MIKRYANLTLYSETSDEIIQSHADFAGMDLPTLKEIIREEKLVVR